MKYALDIAKCCMFEQTLQMKMIYIYIRLYRVRGCVFHYEITFIVLITGLKNVKQYKKDSLI